MLARKSCAGAALLYFLYSANGAIAAKDVTCKSEDYKYKYCSADTRGGVRVDKVHSDAPCDYGTTWGYDDQGVWVDRGCAARFVLGEGSERQEVVQDQSFQELVALCQDRIRSEVVRQEGWDSSLVFERADTFSESRFRVSVQGRARARTRRGNEWIRYNCGIDTQRGTVLSAEYRRDEGDSGYSANQRSVDLVTAELRKRVSSRFGSGAQLRLGQNTGYSAGQYREGVRGSAQVRTNRGWENLEYDAVVDTRRWRIEEFRWGYQNRLERSSPRTGSLSWRGRVDDEVDVVIWGSNIEAREILGKRPENVQADPSGPFPRSEVRVTVRKRDGRGLVFVREQPNSENNFRAVITIRDPQGGADNYAFDLTWR